MDTHFANGSINRSPNKTKKIKLSSTYGDGFGAAMKTGVSDFLQQQKRKSKEFADKPNYINPSATISSGNGSSDLDTAPSPTKKVSIERRHTDNYGRLSNRDQEGEFHLTPCRWKETGWKYSHKDSDYFNHNNKSQNNLGVSQEKLNNIRRTKGYFKTQYMKSFPKTNNSSFDNVQKGVPNQANYVSECYPIISGGDQSAKKYQRAAHDTQYRRKHSMKVEDREDGERMHKSSHRRYHSKDAGMALKGKKIQRVPKVHKNRKNLRKHSHRKSYNKDYDLNVSSEAEGFLRQRKVDIANDISLKPAKILKLLRLEKEKMKRTLSEIKRTSLRKNDTKYEDKLHHTMSSFGEQRFGVRRFDGNRTFYSEAPSQDIGLSTLGGAFSNTGNRLAQNNVTIWGGNVFSDMSGPNFNRKRTFMSEWQSASNNNGVFMKK